ncbi:MAG: glutamyl-tRNA reductase [Microbacteriaceae bacterium]|nr:glutamyl-tRNA reductase [Microbacteriaceae bacterium]
MLLGFTSNHRTAAFDLLERLERRAPDVTAALTGHPELASGVVVLATCNRFETYLEIDDARVTSPDTSINSVMDAISEAAGIDPEELRSSSKVLDDQTVAEHLFAVSSGLESVIVGEGEIAGQVRRALETARAAGTVTPNLERMFQVASRTSRGVKNRTGITSKGRSIVRLALDLAESRITDWAGTRVLMVGTGAYAGASLAALRDRGATDVRVYSPSGRAEKFATAHAIDAIPAGGLEAAIAASDLVVTCSVAPDVILSHAVVVEAVARPDALARRLIIDLGLPRNVAQSVVDIEGVELLDLETISIHAPLAELTATADARAIVGEAAAEFAAQAAEREVTSALVALRAHVFDILDAEIERARGRGDSSEQTEAALRHLAGVLLHTPSVRARELARAGDAASFIAAANTLFGIDIEPASEVADVAELPVAELPDEPTASAVS